jgi:hypothetical protein
MSTMSLNARLAVAAGIAMMLTPLWLPALPFVTWWFRCQRHEGHRRGYKALAAFQARTIEAVAEAAMPLPPSGGWADVARNADRYLAAVRSSRHWRTSVVLTLLEFAPWLRLSPRLSHMAPSQRLAFLERNMATTHGLFAVPALARQIVRMGYYADPSVAAALGFRTMRERRVAPMAALLDAATARQAV